MSIKKYIRNSVMAELNDYCHHAKPSDFIEVTDWANGEGWDITIETGHDSRTFKLTDGELRALMVLVNLRGRVSEEEREPIDWDGN